MLVAIFSFTILKRYFIIHFQERLKLECLIGEIRQVFVDNWYFMKKDYCICEEKENLTAMLKKSELEVVISCCNGTEAIHSHFNYLLNKWSEHANAIISKDFHDAVLIMCEKLYGFKVSILGWLNMLDSHFDEEIAKNII